MATDDEDPGKTRSINDLRGIIRLIQCRQCSSLLQSPVGLPCQETICQACLPPSHKRENITYPIDKEREQGFHCTFNRSDGQVANAVQCGAEHSLADCGLIVALDRVTEILAEKMNQLFLSNDIPSPDTPFDIDATDPMNLVLRRSESALPLSVAFGSTFVALYTLARNGQLPFDAEVTCDPELETMPDLNMFNEEVICDIKETVKPELDCQICLGLMADPCTTPCGHSFCRLCLARILKHSDLCPICRRNLPGDLLSTPENSRLSGLISALFPVQLAERREALKEDGNELADGTKVPLFVTTLSFPAMRTFLYVFEPRYRLMIRRVMESGHRQFGMVTPIQVASSQAGTGVGSHFKEYGTLLEIDRFTSLGDGRCIIRATGQYKFKVLKSTMLDGYDVGHIERVDDIPIAQEETHEAVETGSFTHYEENDEFDYFSTHRLFQIGLTFVAVSKAKNVTWLDDHIYRLYGPPPPDPRLFPYWFATILPRSEEDKYPILLATSVRDRLKMVARWIRKLETGEWVPNSPRRVAPLNPFPSTIQPVSASLGSTLRAVLGTLIVPVTLVFLYRVILKGINSIPDTSSFSFSFLPFSFSVSYTYNHSPRTPAEARQQFQAQLQEQAQEQPGVLKPDSGFVVPSFFDQENMSQAIILGSIFFMCIVRVVKSIVEVIKFERVHAERNRQWETERQAREEARMNHDDGDPWNARPAGAAAPVQPDDIV